MKDENKQKPNNNNQNPRPIPATTESVKKSKEPATNRKK